MSTAKKVSLDKIRNIWIIAHIDAGKTTVTERILYYTWKNHKIGETHDGEWTMDWMDQEQERWITITSAATTCFWNDSQINVIDTPGHVDFTVEVERSLRVLDGWVAVFDGAAWVEPQSETVWRQSDKYKVPRIAFVNKMDKLWADFFMSLQSIEDKLTDKWVAVQIPWWQSSEFKGIIDLITMKAYTYEGDFWMEVVEHEIPDDYKDQANEYREIMVDKISMFDDELAELYLWGEDIPTDLIKKAIRTWVVSNELYPVMCWSALKNAWVQAVLDWVVDYLPSPSEIGYVDWVDPDTWEDSKRKLSESEPTSALAFKIVNDPYVWTLTYVRVYSWVVKSWDSLLNPLTWKKERVWRLILMHANKREEVSEVPAGNICAFLGLKDVRTWHTLTDLKKPIILEQMEFPEPVISMSIEPASKKDQEKMWLGLAKLWYEDPSFRFYTDEESGQTIIAGMWELHLDIIVDRLKREYKVEANIGKPQVSYRETIQVEAKGEGKFTKQTWGRGQYWHVLLRVEPFEDEEKTYEFESEIVWWTIPKEFIPAIDKWAQETMQKWVLAGFPIIWVKVTVYDGSYHEVDSSEVAFKVATFKALKDAFSKAEAVIMEPVMDVEVVTPEEYMGDVMWDLSSRRWRVEWQEQRWNATAINAKVPLSEMFWYATDLRSFTQGRANYVMKFGWYEKLPDSIMNELIEERSWKFTTLDDE